MTTLTPVAEPEASGTSALKIELISTSTNPASTSRELVEQLGLALDRLDVVTNITNAGAFPLLWAGTGVPEEPYLDLMNRVRQSHGVVLAYGVHGYTAPGACKNLADILGPVLDSKPVAFVTAAGSMRSHLAARDLAASLIFENDSYWYPKTLQVYSCSADENAEQQSDRADRLADMAQGFVRFAAALRTVHA